MKYGTLLVIDDNPSILTALKICLGNTFERILTLSRPDTAPHAAATGAGRSHPTRHELLPTSLGSE